MKKQLVWITVISVLLTTGTASAWFWDKKEAKTKEPVTEQKKEPAAPKETPPVEGKGAVAGVKESAREVGGFFKEVGKDTKEKAKEVSPALKKEGKAVKEGFKESGKEIARKTKQIPKAVKEGAKELGQDFKELGKEIRKDVKETFK